MNSRQGHQQAPPPGATAPGGNAAQPGPNGMTMPQANQQAAMNGAVWAPQQQVPSHLLGLMTNPALAAAAAASPLFPPAAMISNPGAFFAMPEAYANGGVGTNNNATSNQGMLLPGMGVPMQNQNSNFNLASVAPSSNQSNQELATLTQFQQGQGTTTNTSQLPNQLTAFQALAPNGTPMQVQNNPSAANSSIGAALSNGGASQSLVQVPAKSPGGKGRPKNEESKSGAGRTRRTDLTPAERAKQNRDRNREHARSTRLRKKAYVQKLNELVEGLHAERAAEVRQRRVAIQHLAETQNVRRTLVRSFLRFHSNYETSIRKWAQILEDNFWLKQPVTPYRSFRRGEIEQECRLSRGIEAVIADAASLSVMVEGIGSRSARWLQIKKEDFFIREETKNGSKHMPRCVVRQGSRLQHAVSSLSSSSGSSNGSGGEEAGKQRKHRSQVQQSQNVTKHSPTDKSKSENAGTGGPRGATKISSSSGSSNESRRNQQKISKDFHDYHAQPLPDPKLADSDGSSPSDESPEELNNSGNSDTKRVSTDSSSGDDSAVAVIAPRPTKRRKGDSNGSSSDNGYAPRTRSLPPNIAKAGGIAHSVRPMGAVAVTRNGNPRLSAAPAIALPPFAGIGKRPLTTEVALPTAGDAVANPGLRQQVQAYNGSEGGVLGNKGVNSTTQGAPAMISAEMDTSSNGSQQKQPQIRAYYHVNEDDMILMDDVLMCPFIFRSQDAVLCGALAECVMPGMLRAHFSQRNKLQSLELVYDAMGFMQQLERASGSEGMAQIVPGSLEMALTPSATEARVITLAEAPFQIVNVNEAWTRMTKYTQMEVEGRELLSLLEGQRTVADAGVRRGKPLHRFDEVVKGRCAASTNIHYDKEGEEFVEYMCSYPLTNANDEVTHLLHICKELPSLPEAEKV